MIEFKKVSLAYIKEYYTLMNVNLNVDKNTLIIGTIDDGTHTLMRIVANIDKDYTGDVIIDGKNLRNISDRDLNLSYIPSVPYLLKNKSVFDNLYYPLKIRKVKKKVATPIINGIIAKYLKDFPTKIKKMSNSEKKILTLLRTMIRKPKYVLIEDLFQDLDDKYIELSHEIVTEISNNSIIIACESNDDYYLNFDKYSLSYGSLNKK